MSLVPTREDQAFGAGYQQASEAGGMVIDHLGKRLRAVEAERDGLRAALREILFNAENGEWTLPSSFAARARTALNLAHPTP